MKAPKKGKATCRIGKLLVRLQYTQRLLAWVGEQQGPKRASFDEHERRHMPIHRRSEGRNIPASGNAGLKIWIARSFEIIGARPLDVYNKNAAAGFDRLNGPSHVGKVLVVTVPNLSDHSDAKHEERSQYKAQANDNRLGKLRGVKTQNDRKPSATGILASTNPADLMLRGI